MRFRTYATKTVKFKIPPTYDMEITLPKSYSTWRERINYHMSRLALNIFSFFGGTRKHLMQEWGNDVSFVEVDTDNVLDGLFKIIKSSRNLDDLIHKNMIIIGNDCMREIMNIPMDTPAFYFVAQTRVNIPESLYVGYKHIAYYLDVPIFYVPNFKGVAIIPDLTQQHNLRRA